MKKKFVIGGCVLLAFVLFGGILFFNFHEKSIQEIVSENKPLISKYMRNSPDATIPLAPVTTRAVKQVKSKRKDKLKENAGDKIKPSAGDYSTSRIEDIKKRIYEKNIEYVEQLPLLDELVETGDADTREFWADDWTSVDDWKKNDNGFSLKRNDDGGLVFTPDEQTSRLYTFFENPLVYTYDEKNKEFVNEVDYYGKTIYNVAKFINNNVLVMMTISGRKVDLNIYQKKAPRE